MNLPSLSISRHVLAAAFSLLIVLLGLVGFTRVGVDRLPNVEFPTLTISTGLPGASPATVAQTVTQPLEARLNTISGIDNLSSVSSSGRSSITISFSADKDMAEALNDVQSRVSQARRELPADADASVVQKFDINAEPVLWMTLSGARTPMELTLQAQRIQRRLETVAGVGEVRLRGDATQVLAVTLDERRLAALDLTAAEVRQAFAAQHLSGAGGRLKTEGRQFQLELDFEFKTPEELAEMPLTTRDGRQIRLSDVALVQEAPADTRGFARYNGQPAVALGIVRASGANPVDVIDAVRQRVQEELAPRLEEGMKLEVVSDEGAPIKALVSSLQSHLLEGTLLTALVTWLFLKSLRATTVIATAIPVSLLGAVAVLFLADYTFNSFTLLALLLLIGVVVDDAIVVLENIYRTREHNPDMGPEESAARGSSEVMFAVMAATLTLVCVFGPVIFLPGVLGQFFTAFAVTVVVGVLVSWFVSMTLTPMLCAKFLRSPQADKGVTAWLEQAFRRMEARYLQGLVWSLKFPKTLLLLAALTLVPSAFLFTQVKKEFSPQVEDGRLSVTLNVPSGLSRPELLDLSEKAEETLSQFPEVAGTLSTFNDGGRSGSDSISLSVTLHEQRKRSQAEVMAELERRLAQEPGWRSSVRAGASVGGGAGGAPLQFVLQGPNFEELRQHVERMQDTLSAKPGLQGLRHNLDNGLPQLQVQIDRAAAARAGVSPREVSQSVAALTGQAVLGRYTSEKGERQDVVLRSGLGTAPSSAQVLDQVQVRSAQGQRVALAGLVTPVPQGAPSALQRYNQQYAVSFSASPTISLGEAVAFVREAAAELPPEYSVQFTGQAEEFRKVGGNLGLMFGLALVLLYLVLASQFNSYGQPFVVMLAQPLAIIGGVGALYLTGQTLNIYSIIGLMLLLGLVAKTSILLVDQTNQAREQGMTAREALLHACPMRLRPVLMTSLTVILAMLPAAMGLGAGAENNQPLSVAIIGGMVSSTVLTLFVVPAAYLAWQRKEKTQA